MSDRHTPKPEQISRKKRNRKQKYKKPVPICMKCDTTERMTRHHVIPRTHLIFFDIKPQDAPTVSLCFKCHGKIEEKILWTEAFYNRTRIGDRKPLPKTDDYWFILSLFIGPKRFAELLRAGIVQRHPTQSKI
jgi:5-methylcytosine-specific restriction endonuclease McrA